MPSAYDMAVSNVNKLKDQTFRPKDYAEVVQAFALIAIVDELKDIRSELERLRASRARA